MSTSGGEHIHSSNTSSGSRRVSSIPLPSVARGGGPNEIVVTDNDVLCGRGHSVSSHKGNARLRKLVSSHKDENYCSAYKTIEKRAVADKIIAHIHSLNPPGRFLKKPSKHRPWEEMTYDEALKKTVQALRDANRQDRAGYAEAVTAPEDVKQHAAKIEKQGLTKRQFAKKAAVDFVAKIRDIPQITQAKPPSSQMTVNPSPSLPPPLALGPGSSKRQGLTTRGLAKRTAAIDFATPAPLEGFQAGPLPSDAATSLPPSPPDVGSITSSQWTNSSPEFAAASPGAHAHLPSVTPSTVARPAQPLLALFEDDRKPAARENFFHHPGGMAPSPTGDAMTDAFQDSPRLDDSGEEGFAGTFTHTTSGPNPNDALDVMAARAAAGMDDHEDAALHHQADDYPSNLFHDVDDDVQISAANAFEDPKY